jgi:flagellin
MSVINTNSKSIIAQNSLTVNNRAMTKTMEQLSTGKRINSAADDAAGLAISSKMTSQIKGLNQAVRNANDGISMLQTADGAMVEVTNMLQRMRELAVQSSTDTNTQDDRTYLDNEFQQLKNEIDRIAENTEWNGSKILNENSTLGSNTAGQPRLVQFQVGANASQTIDVTFKKFDFASSTSGVTASSAQVELGALADGAAATAAVVTIGGTALTFDKTTDFTALAANPTSANITTFASELQTAIRGRSGYEGVSVSSTGEVLTIEDPAGRSIGGFTLTGATAANVVFTAAAGSSTTGSSESDSVFYGSAAIHSLVITDKANSNTSITALDYAIKAVNTERSTFGAAINRLSYAGDNLTNVSQNTSASRSRVLDTDYAQATTELARTQIISQAATAMLAQANQAPQSVLSLLR